MSDEAPVPLFDSVVQKLLALKVEEQPGFAKLDAQQILGARFAMIALQTAVTNGRIRCSEIEQILDFGAGFGGPTFAVVKMAEIIGAEVEAVEEMDNRRDKIVSDGILPSNKVYPGDGFSYLQAAGKGRYDLVTAFWFGIDNTGEFFARLSAAAGESLSDRGRLLLTSDDETIADIENVLGRIGMADQVLQPVIGPKLIVIPQKTLLQLF